jgi:hypothetical protein
MPYPLAPPQGRKAVWIFEKQQLAISKWQLAGKSKTSPLMSTDDTDQEKRLNPTPIYNPNAPTLRQSLLIHAKTAHGRGPVGCLGITSVKAFGILIGARGEGCAKRTYRRNRRHRASSPRSGGQEPLTTKHTKEHKGRLPRIAELENRSPNLKSLPLINTDDMNSGQYQPFRLVENHQFLPMDSYR